MGNTRRVKIGKTYLNEKGENFTPVKYVQGKSHQGIWSNSKKEGVYVDANGNRRKSSNLTLKQL